MALDPASLQAMSVDELAAAREQASPEDKQAIDAEIARRQQSGDEDDGSGDGGGSMDSDTSGSDSRGDIKGDTSGDDAGGDAGGDMPYGSTVISSACEALQTASADIRQAMRTVEHPEVRAALANAVETLDGISSDLQGTYGKHYPDSPPIGDTSGADASAADAAVMKSFLAMGRDRQYQGKGLLQKVKMFESEMPAHLRPRFKTIRASLERMMRPGSMGSSSDVEALRKETAELQKLVEKMAVR